MFGSVFRSLVLAFAAAALVTSCSSKKKEDDASNAAMDGKVSSKDIGMDALGSDGGKIAGLYTVNFEYDQARLTTEARRKLADNAQWMKSNPNSTLQIEGHCDQRGSIEYNLSLGERRAQAVKRYMVSIGADGNRLTTISYGKEKLLDNGDSESAMARNRRANFVPLSK
jgi:peptidoglycan-associated lipoprotein